MTGAFFTFKPPTFSCNPKDKHEEFQLWKGDIALAPEGSQVIIEKLYSSITHFLGDEGFRDWQSLDIAKPEKQKKKDPTEVFKAIESTLGKSTFVWNYIDELYSDMKWGE